MSVSIRLLDPASDGPQMLALTRRCDTGTDRFRVDRGPDPFALGRFFGPTQTFGAFLGDVLAGTAAVSVQRRWVRGEERDVDYLHDLRVDPDQRGQGVAHALGQAVAAARGKGRPTIGTVLGDNPLLDAVVRGTGRWLGTPTRLGCTAHVVATAPAPAVAGVNVSELTARAWHEAHARLSPRHGFAPVAAVYAARGRGRLLAASIAGEIVAVAMLCDERDRRRILAGGVELAGLSYLAFLTPSQPTPEVLAGLIAAAVDIEPTAQLIAYGLDASSTSTPPALTSTTWGFGLADGGAPPPPLAAHELLLI